MRDVRAPRVGGWLVVITAACAVTVAGCGDDSQGGDRGKAKTETRPAAFDAAALLIRAGDEPGFAPRGAPQTETKPLPMAPAGTRKLRQSGFVSTVFVPLDAKAAAGAGSITVFRTARGARAWMEHETTDAGIKEQIPHPGKIRHFTVPGVPGGRGWTGRD